MDRHRDDTIDIQRTDDVEAGRKGGAVAYAGAAPTTYAERGDEEAGERAYLGISRVGWSGIWAGLFVGIMSYLLLTMLGFGLGILNVAGPAMGTGGAIWVIFSSLISFFIGGFIAGRMNRLPGRANGAMNGLVYGSFAILFLAFLSLFPVMQLLPSVAQLFSQMGGLVNMNVPNVNIQAVSQQVQTAAWWSLLGMILALGAAILGGWSGAREAITDPLATGEGEHHHHHH